jgi:AcrR family transcriptional regulator
MRAVAAELDTGAASLYVYVESRQDLLNQMFDLVAGEVDLGGAPDSRAWRTQVEALLTRVLAAMERHPGIARVPLANVPTGPNATRIADRVIGLLRAGGVDPRSIAWFVDVVFLFVNATAYERSIYRDQETDPGQVGEQVRDRFAALDPSEYPNLLELMPLLTAGSGEERFAFGVRLMIDGLVQIEPPDRR